LLDGTVHRSRQVRPVTLLHQVADEDDEDPLAALVGDELLREAVAEHEREEQG
jgi:hypothetical protein